MSRRRWWVTKRINDFRNLKDINFEFIRGGINIIVGENNAGKTNFLDYIYEKNHDWDNFVVSEENYEKESSPKGLVPGYRYSYSLLGLFFPNVCFSGRGVDYVTVVNYFSKDLFIYNLLSESLLHASNPRFNPSERPREGKITISYKIFYFDLNATTSFLNKDKKKLEKLELKRTKMRSWEIYYGKLEETSSSFRDYFIIESENEPKEEKSGWIPDYEGRKNFIKHQGNDGVIYYGFNKNISHPLDKLGSGYLKYETIVALIENLKKEKQFERGESYKNSESRRKVLPYSKLAHTPILLMDEPEVFLHSTFVFGLANSIKEAGKENITTFLTTHSPSFLLHFVDELLDGEVNLIVIQKDENSANLKNPLYFQRIIEEKIKKRIRIDCKEFGEKREKMGDEIKFNQHYKDKWKRLFNRETLRIFFSKNVLFVEGMQDYILFNNVLREELNKELKDLEIIPIFSKWHYIYFSELSKQLNLNYWFLLDDDRKFGEKGKPNNGEHEKFWLKYGEGKTEGKKNGISHSFELFIDIEEIINNYDITKTKENAIKQIDNLLKDGKINEKEYFSEEFQDWKNKINRLNNKGTVIDFAKLMEKEINPRISWFSSNIEIFLFGKNIDRDKEYTIISKAPEIIEELKKYNSAKLNELKKILRFINSQDK